MNAQGPNLFRGRARPLTLIGLQNALDSLGEHNITEREIWAVLRVETSGCGFYPDRRPVILFERHLFHRFTDGRFDDSPSADPISSPAPGGYGGGGDRQYVRLARAASLDRRAALEATSWGIGQVLGMNASVCGFGSAEEMALAMTTGEDAQLAAVAAFLRQAGLGPALAAHNWTEFARGYNGPNFRQNGYDLRLSVAVGKPAPDLRVRAVQMRLRYAGLNPGPVDGVLGTKTMTAILRYTKSRDLHDEIGLDELLADLEKEEEGPD